MEGPSKKLAPGLYLVATPIGNLEDLSLRAKRVLSHCDLIIAEDTRHSGLLMKHIGHKKPFLSCHEQNEQSRVSKVCAGIRSGQAIALVTDAGTPGISDPGYRILREVIREGLHLESIPGPSAPILALSLSGLPMDRFVFEGFLPRKPGKAKKVLEALKELNRTIIFFESPYRIEKTLELILEILGNRKVALCRELTKKFQEVLRGDLEKILQENRNRKWKGEITLVVAGCNSKIKK